MKMHKALFLSAGLSFALVSHAAETITIAP